MGNDCLVTPVKDFKVNVLPNKGEPNSRYYVLKEDGTVEEWITDKHGEFKRVASGLAGVIFEAGTSSAVLDRVTFSNSNNVSFGLSGSVITATAGFPQSTRFLQSSLSSAFLQTGYTTHSHSQYLTTQTQFLLSNSNGLTFGTNGSTVIASYSVPTDYISSNQSSRFQQTSLMSNYLGTTYTSHTHDYLGSTYTTHTHSQYLGTDYTTHIHSQYLTTQTQFLLSNSNGISFGTDGSTVTASYTVPTDYISSNQSSLFQHTSLMSNYLGTTYTSHTHSEYLGTDYTSHTHSIPAQTQFVLSNSNGISFGTNGSTVTASYTVPTDYINISNSSLFEQSSHTTIFLTSQSIQTQNMVSINGSTGNISFANSNGVTFGFNNSTVTASVAASAANSSLTVSDANTSGTLARLAFTNSNGLTLSLSTGTGGRHTVVGSYTVPTDYISIGQSSLFQHTSLMSDYLGTGYTTHTHSQYEHTSHTTVFLTSQSAQALSGSNGSFAFQTATLGNLNGLSFYTSNGSMVGSYTVPSDYVSSSQSSLFEQTSHTTVFLTSQSNQAASGSNGSFGFQTLSFGNANGISFYTTNSSIVASVSAVPAASLSSASISAGASSETLSNLVFSNSNGISFGLSNGTITGTVKTDYLTTAMASDAGTRFVQATAVFNGTNATGTIASNAISVSVANATNSSLTMQAGGSTLSSVSRVAFVDGNGISFGASTSNNGSISITASHNALTSQSGQAISVGNGSFAFQTATFGDANGFSFLTSNGSIVGSYTVPGPGGAIFAVSASNSSISSGTLVFSNSNGISFGLSDSTVTAAHNALTSQSGQAISGSNGSLAFQTATFGNLNGLSFYTSNGSIVGSYTVPMVGGAQTGISGIAASDATYTSGSVTFRDGNGISWASTTGQQISITHGLQYTSNTSAITSNALHTSQSSLFQHTSATSAITSAALHTSAARVINVIAATNNTGGGTASLSSNVSFSNANNVTFYTSAGNAVVASFSQSVDTGKAGTGFTSTGTNIGLSGTLNSNGLSLAASVAAPGAAAENNAINLLGANTSGNTTATGSTIGWSGLNLTFSGTNASQVVVSAPATSLISGTGRVSISTNGSTVSIGVPHLSVTAGNGSSLGSLSNLYFSNANGISFGLSTSNNGSATLTASTNTTGIAYRSGISPYGDLPLINAQVGQGSLILDPEYMPNVAFDRLVFLVNNTNATNSSGSHTLSMWFGIYTKNGDNLSLYASASNSTAVTHSGTAGSYSLFSGMRGYTIGMTTSLTENQYWMAYLSRTTSAGADGSYSNFVISNNSSSTFNFVGFFGSSHNTSMQRTLGNGYLSVTTNGMPTSIALSAINGSNSAGFRFPIVHLANATSPLS